MNTETNISAKKKTQPFKIFLRLLYLISLLIYFYYLVDGLPYYQTALQDRPQHEDYRNLRPAGFRSHGFGIIGSAMMLFMLVYSLRKRLKFMRRWGNLSHWLDIHIYCGVIGPLLIILHTSFKVQGLVAVSFWSMVAVALSGVLGRYLYLQIPRNLQGDELSLKDINKWQEEINTRIKEEFHLTEEMLTQLEKLISVDISEKRGVMAILFSIIYEDIRRPLKIRRIKREFAERFNIPPSQLQRFIIVTRRKTVFNRRIQLLNQVNRLFHYWHVFHKPFAIIMYLIMLVHVGIAVWLGYTWIW